MDNKLQITSDNALAVFAGDDTNLLDAILSQIEQEAKSLIPDVSTQSGRDAIKNNAAKVVKSKLAMEAHGKQLADQQKAIPKKIDASRRRCKSFLSELKTLVRKPLTDWETAEKERVETLSNRLHAIEQMTQFNGQPNSTELKAVINRAKAIPIDDTWDEFKEKAEIQKNRVIIELMENLDQAKKAEAELEKLRREAAELEQLRLEAAERKAKQQRQENRRQNIERKLDKIRFAPSQYANLSINGLTQKIEEWQSFVLLESDWDDRIDEARKSVETTIFELGIMIESAKKAENQKILQAKAQAIKESEDKAAAEKIKAEKDKQDAIHKAHQEMQEKENLRIAEEQRQKEVKRQREANEIHRRAIEEKAAVEIVSQTDLTPQQAEQVITLIVSGQIPNVSVAY